MSSQSHIIRLRRSPLGRYRYVRLRWRVLFAAIDLVGGLLFGAAQAMQAMASRIWPRGQELPTPDPRTILIVQLDHLGDAVLTTPILPLLRQHYPQASIEVLAGPWNREFFEAVPEVDHVHVCRASRFAGTGAWTWVPATFWWGWKMRRRHVDLAIDVRGEFPHALILWLSGARQRVGWRCGGGGFLLTHSPQYVPGRPEVQSRLALLAELLGDHPNPPASQLVCQSVFRPTAQARRAIAARLARLWRNVSSTGPLLVVHISAGTPAKQWPPEHWQEWIARILLRLDAQIVLVGSVEDRKIANAILGGRHWPGVVDWTGRLGVVELAALVERADLLVGADSGPAHLAAAVGTPAAVLFSGTNNPRQWRPATPNVAVLQHAVECSPCHRKRCPLPDHPCMRCLLPEGVAHAVETLYKKTCRGLRRQPAAESEADRHASARSQRHLSDDALRADREGVRR